MPELESLIEQGADKRFFRFLGKLRRGFLAQLGPPRRLVTMDGVRLTDPGAAPAGALAAPGTLADSEEIA